jgi:hypothetical protein
MVHHYLGVKPVVEISSRNFSIVLTNSATGEQVTVSGPRSAPIENGQRKMSPAELDSLANHLANAVSRWEAASKQAPVRKATAKKATAKTPVKKAAVKKAVAKTAAKKAVAKRTPRNLG